MQNRIKELRKERGFSQETLAEKVGAVKSQISKLEKGGMRLNDKWIERLSVALACAPTELISDFDTSSDIMIPVIGDVPGGDLMLAMEEEPDTFISFSGKRTNVCALRVRGNSMSRIAPDGCYVIVDTSEIDPLTLVNQPVIILMNNGFEWDCIFKIYKKNPDRFEPFSIESGYDTIFPAKNDWKIFGRVIGSVGYIGDDARLLRIEEK
jgi:transcriptional regulator with XRE-family HTH domain